MRLIQLVERLVNLHVEHFIEVLKSADCDTLLPLTLLPLLQLAKSRGAAVIAHLGLFGTMKVSRWHTVAGTEAAVLVKHVKFVVVDGFLLR